MNKKIYLTLILSFSLLFLPLSSHAAAVVKGEVPKVEPLQALPQSIKPNYDHNVQSGKFETTSELQQQKEAAQQEAPIPAAKVRSSSSNFLFYLIIILILMIPICYFSWKKIKQKQ